MIGQQATGPVYMGVEYRSTRENPKQDTMGITYYFVGPANSLEQLTVIVEVRDYRKDAMLYMQNSGSP